MGTTKPRTINLVVIHCSDTPDGRPQNVVDIDSWHRARGWERRPEWRKAFNSHLTSIGYHYVIYTDGTVHTGRHLDEIGAHAVGYNSYSVGICMVGCSKFTLDQWTALRKLVQQFQVDHNITDIRGHRELPKVSKSCPGFSVKEWLENGLTANAMNVLQK